MFTLVHLVYTRKISMKVLINLHFSHVTLNFNNSQSPNVDCNILNISKKLTD